ncbi:MAG TPA: CCA tRNA nucleotidyltransferase [Deltaproteobacteria bacterium]|nr:CCA tRNA nucleotidyltransferase [Deltaproteobacteria bacterium]
MMPPQLPDSIHHLAEAITSSGGRAYLVGGGVRDHWLGRTVKDWDIEVFGLELRALITLLRRLGRVNTVGRSFGVLKWSPRGRSRAEEIDVSIPRRDSKVGPGHRGIAVEGDPDMSVEEAARRRDLTINAMMWDIIGGQLVDPWGGLDDLQSGRLRAVDRDTFLEDPLRALRVVQFAARLGFETDPELLELCRTAALGELPAERIQGEWGKLLLKALRPSRGFAVARQTRILERVFPEAAALDADQVLDQLAAGHRDEAGGEGRRWALMLAGWLHRASAEGIEQTLDRLWMHSVQGYPVRARVLGAVATWGTPLQTDAQIRHASVHAELRLVIPLRSVILGEDPAELRARVEALGVLESKPAALLLGRHLGPLGVPPGPQMGEILRAVYEQQLDGTVHTLEGAEAAAREIWSALSSTD